MRQFPPSPIVSGLLDATPEYKLGESTGPDLTVADLLADDVNDLAKLPLGYGTSAGHADLRELVAANTGADADHVLITAGAAAALFLLGLSFGDDGDIVVARPCFPPTLDVLRGTGARVRELRLTFDGGYRIDEAALEEALTPDTRLVMLASPQNPAAVSLTRDEADTVLAAMARVCPDAYLLIDETFREGTHGVALPEPSFAAYSPRVLTCASLSKSHGAPGLRVGWLTVPDAELYETLRLAKFNSAIACGSLDEYLAVRLLRRADELMRPRRALLAEGADLVGRWVAEQAELDWIAPDTTPFCCVRLDPAIFDAARVRRFHDELARRGVAVAKGEWFGDDEHVFRLGYGHEPMEKLHAGLDLITKSLQAL